MEKRKFDVVITRHQALVELLREKGLIDEQTQVVEHATPDLVVSKHVCGVLPHSLSCLTASFTEVPLNLTPEMRGKELTLDDLRKVAGEPVTYKVLKIQYTYPIQGGQHSLCGE